MRRVICALSLTALLAGCGGSGSSSSTTAAAPRGFATIEDAAYRHAVCMRRHGVPAYPDPRPVDHNGEQGIKQDLPPGMISSPAFQLADRACAGILPLPQNEQNAQGNRQHELGLLAFARCMRSHGVSNFPDPNAQGQITDEAVAAAGIDVHLHYVTSAAVACIPSSHGAVSRAVIAQAVNQAG